jgi:hypothetical protein
MTQNSATSLQVGQSRKHRRIPSQIKAIHVPQLSQDNTQKSPIDRVGTMHILQQKLRERSASPVPTFSYAQAPDGPSSSKYQLDYSPNAKVLTIGNASTQEQTTKMSND